jgi:hypothetical protein
MKKIMLYVTVITICITCIGCWHSEAGLFSDPPSKKVVALYDNTDMFLARPTRDIVSLFKLNNQDIYLGYDLRVRVLSSVNLTDAYEERVPAQNKLTGDEMRRIALIKAFRKNAYAKLDSVYKEKITPQQNSVLYRTIAQELNELAKSKAQTRVAVLYTDLQENSEDANFISLHGFAELKLNPQAVASRLQKVVPLSDLHGITLYIAFKPSSYEQELKFNAALAAYRIMLESKGATLIVTANISSL